VKESVEGGFAGANGVGGGKTGEVGLRSHPLSIILHPTSAFMPTHCKWSMRQLDLACSSLCRSNLLYVTQCGRQYSDSSVLGKSSFGFSDAYVGGRPVQLLLQPCSSPQTLQQAKVFSIVALASFNLPAQTARQLCGMTWGARQAVERGYPAPGRLWPVAEAVAVLARAVTQVQAHAGPLVLDAQSGKGACPHIYCLLKWEVWVHLTLDITCGNPVSCCIVMRCCIVVCTQLMHENEGNAMYTCQINMEPKVLTI